MHRILCIYIHALCQMHCYLCKVIYADYYEQTFLYISIHMHSILCIVSYSQKLMQCNLLIATIKNSDNKYGLKFWTRLDQNCRLQFCARISDQNVGVEVLARILDQNCYQIFDYNFGLQFQTRILDQNTGLKDYHTSS